MNLTPGSDDYFVPIIKAKTRHRNQTCNPKRQVSINTLRNDLHKILGHLNIYGKKLSFHSCKKAAAFRSLEAGKSIEEIRIIGRWKSRSMVYRYLGITNGRK